MRPNLLAQVAGYRLDSLHGVALLGALGAFFGLANPVARLPVLVVLYPWCLARISLTAQSPRQAASRGYLCGVLAAAASLYWLALPVHDFGGLPWVLALPCPLLMAMALGMYPAAFCWLMATARPGLSPVALGAFAGVAWWSIEYLRGVLFTGFPWTIATAAFAPWPAWLQSLSVIGAYGFSAIMAAGAAWLAAPGRPAACLAACAALWGATAAHGLWAADHKPPQTATFRAALIQGNVDQSHKWDPAYQSATVDHYLALSAKTLPEGPDVIFWPETAMPLYLQDASTLSRRLAEFVKTADTPLVTGAPGYTRAQKNTPVFNRAYLIGSAGLAAYYDKQHLVPFGEYAPFGEDVPILSELLQGVGAFTPGRHSAPMVSGRLAMGMLICYESIFTELAQQRVADGANVLVNISNDAWFGRSAAPAQHLDLAVLRAIEQGRFIVRSTNTGISAVIGPTGRVLTRTGLFEDAAVTYGGVGLIEEKTLYHRLFGWLAALAGLSCAGLFGLALYNKRLTTKV